MDEIIQFGYMTFKDYLDESFEPKETEFGTDTKNSNWKLLDHNFRVTFFKTDEKIIVVLYREGHIGFGSTKLGSDLDSIKTFDDLNKIFTFKPSAIQSALSVFNKVLYVIGTGLKLSKPNEIYFNGSNSDLIRLYSKLVKDKSFLNTINKYGYEYKGLESGHGQNIPTHTFRKI